MADVIRIIDKEVTGVLRGTMKQVSGRKRWPVPGEFRKYKTPKLHDPWKKKGIDEQGRTGTWAPNAASTVGRRWRRQRKFSRMLTGQAGRGRWRVRMKDRTDSIMLDSRKMYHSIRFAWSKKFKQFVLKIKGEAGKYAYIHLFGNRANLTPARPWGVWTKNDLGAFVKIFQDWWVKSFRGGRAA